LGSNYLNVHGFYVNFLFSAIAPNTSTRKENGERKVLNKEEKSHENYA